MSCCRWITPQESRQLCQILKPHALQALMKTPTLVLYWAQQVNKRPRRLVHPRTGRMDHLDATTTLFWGTKIPVKRSTDLSVRNHFSLLTSIEDQILNKMLAQQKMYEYDIPTVPHLPRFGEAFLNVIWTPITWRI